MKGVILRKFLLLTAAIVIAGQFFRVILPHLNGQAQMIAAGDETSPFTVFMQDLTYFFIALPIALLCIWAAHNLRPIKKLTNKTLINLLLMTQVLVGLGLLFECIKTHQAYAPYFPEFIMPTLPALLETVNWFLYSVAELLALSFAVFQLKAKSDNQSINVSDDQRAEQ